MPSLRDVTGLSEEIRSTTPVRHWKLGGSGIVVTPKTAPREAGRLGGHARAKAIGKEGMREIAKRGGAATAAKGKAHLAEMGRRGQLARAANIRHAVLKEVEAHVLVICSSVGALSESGRLLAWIRAEMAKVRTRKSGTGPGG